MTTPPQPGSGPAPTPREGRPNLQPVSERQQMIRALVVLLQRSGFFKHVTEDVLNLDPVPAELRPAVVVFQERTRGTEMNRHDKGRPWRCSVDLVLDIQGQARSNNEKSLGYNTSATRNALSHQVLLVLANNPGLEVQLEELGETEPQAHAIDALVSWSEETVPVAPPLTRTLLRVTVELDEFLDLRQWQAWRLGVLEGAPEGGEYVTATEPFKEE